MGLANFPEGSVKALRGHFDDYRRRTAGGAELDAVECARPTEVNREGMMLVDRGKCETASTDRSVTQECVWFEWAGKFCSGLDFGAELLGEEVLRIFCEYRAIRVESHGKYKQSTESQIII